MFAPDPDASQLCDWLERHRAGHTPNPDALYRLCEAHLRLMARRRLQGFPLARRLWQTTDVVNDSFMKLHRALRTLTLETTSDLYRLLAANIRYVLLDMVKFIRKRPDLCGDRPPVIDLPDDEPIPLEDWQGLLALHVAIGGLPDDERLLADLIFYCALSVPKAAEELGVPMHRVKADWARVRATLRTALLPFFKN